MGFSLWRLLLFRACGLGLSGFSSFSTWAQWLWCTSLVTLQHVGSSQTRDWTCVPCVASWILSHWTAREAPQPISYSCYFWALSSWDYFLRRNKLDWGGTWDIDLTISFASLVAQMVKNLPTMRGTQVWSLDQEDPLEKEIATHPAFLPGKFYGIVHNSLVGYSPRGHKESAMTERLTLCNSSSTLTCQRWGRQECVWWSNCLVII